EGVSSGLEGLARPWPVLALQVATLVGGVLLTRAAVAAARAAALKTEAAAVKAAEQKKSEYAEFAAEAERLAAQREASPIAPAGPPAGQGAKPP
ncbi:MAG: hypothetical protein ACYC8T_09970, partial [Myxococcaceae bacterium]